MQKARAFTLVELLVVMAVISALAAILLPVLQKVQETARQVACLNNLKQIGIFTIEFAEDHHGWPPPANSYPRYGTWLYGQGYLTGVVSKWSSIPRQNGIFGCPSEPDQGSGDSLSNYGYRGSHYGQNSQFGDPYKYGAVACKIYANFSSYIPGKTAVIAEAHACAMPHTANLSKTHWNNSIAGTYYSGTPDVYRHADRKVGVWIVDGRAKHISYWEAETCPP